MALYCALGILDFALDVAPDLAVDLVPDLELAPALFFVLDLARDFLAFGLGLPATLWALGQISSNGQPSQ